MNVTFACPRCQQGARVDLDPTAHSFTCPACDQQLEVPAGAVVNGQVQRCLVCPSVDLFVRKDFPQRLGVGIVAVGILASCITWGYSYLIATFAILFATALIDVVLYAIVPEALMCYRCGAMYRLSEHGAQHGPFNLETHERHRQQAARMAGHHSH